MNEDDIPKTMAEVDALNHASPSHIAYQVSNICSEFSDNWVLLVDGGDRLYYFDGPKTNPTWVKGATVATFNDA